MVCVTWEYLKRAYAHTIRMQMRAYLRAKDIIGFFALNLLSIKSNEWILLIECSQWMDSHFKIYQLKIFWFIVGLWSALKHSCECPKNVFSFKEPVKWMNLSHLSPSPKKKICPERFFIDWFSSINRLDFSLNWKRFILYLVNSLLFEQRKLMLQYWLPITIVRLFTLLYNLSAI